MIEIMSRRMRVRDDGTGKGREQHGTFAEFEAEDAIILLGDPGMGKTTLFEEAAKTYTYTKVRNFLIAPQVTDGKALFLDALDEYRTLTRGQDASADLARALCALNKPKFRLSCRAADWFGSADQEVFRVASASGRVVVLELCPLSREEILHAVQEIVPDPVVFLHETESAGLGKLLGNPQTLELFARAWGTGRKPRNKFEAYEIGIAELLKETNEKHVQRGMASPDLLDLRKAACAATSLLLLSNSVGIAGSDSADGDGYVKFSTVSHPDRSSLEAVLKRRLFTSPAVDRYEPVHRTIAEFLAAEDLSERIAEGLPIDRVMALICGIDGKPLSSLRGLFAWLMCKLGHLAEDYAERDPYGVAMYGDASVLPPKAQCAIWQALRRLRDPWFLANEEDSGSFHNLANQNTVRIIEEILQDPEARVHLKIAVLESISNSTENTGLNAVIRDVVLEKSDNTWLRSAALKAFTQAVMNDLGEMEALDKDLCQATDDPAAPELRVDLLSLMPKPGNLALRLLSFMEQAAARDSSDHVFGHFYPLLDLPSDADLDAILDGAPRVLRPESETRYEFRSLYDRWFERRLSAPAPITAIQLSNWLRYMQYDRRDDHPKALAALKARFAHEPSLFAEIFELLATGEPNGESSYWSLVAHDLWQMLPASVWPITPAEFFLARAEKENDPERAVDLFRMYLSWFPLEGASTTLMETGFALVERRPDLAAALGDWRICKLEKWQTDQPKRREKERRRKLAERAENIAYLTPRLTLIREGGEERVLAWAALFFSGLYYDVKDIPDPRHRLVTKTNDEIADALVQGFIRYGENPGIPKKKDIIESWLANSVPPTHFLLGVSIFLRNKEGMTIPEAALPHCIAAVVTASSHSGEVPDYDDSLFAWFLQQVRQQPAITESVLSEIWLAAAMNKNKGSLPRFYQLCKDPDSQQFLAALSVMVLKAGINEDDDTVGRLVSVLLRNDQAAALTIGKTELARQELADAVRAIWTTVLFVLDPNRYSAPWRDFMAGADISLFWKAMLIFGGDRYQHGGPISLTAAQRTEIIIVFGKRYVNVGRPQGGWSGTQNSWDASDFIINQIKMLAADGSADVGSQFERLENDSGLTSYRDQIRHHRSQYEKQQRETHFTFASPERVAEAIKNCAPATPSDLLIYTVDHLETLSFELTRTQRERFRAYWNETGRNLDKPKREEICSGLLAEDLQNRVRAHELIVTVEHHMIADKECDIVVLQGTDRLLPIEVKHHYNGTLWTAWRSQLDRLYTRDAKAGGLGVYLVLWSGKAKGGMMPKLPDGLKRPASAIELKYALESLIPSEDRQRLRIVVVDISPPAC